MPLGLTKNGMGLEGIMQMRSCAPFAGGSQDSAAEQEDGLASPELPILKKINNNNNTLFILPPNTALPRNDCTSNMTVAAYFHLTSSVCLR